jgi:hypothetical protein
MVVLSGAYHKLAILRAFFYGRRRGIRGAEGARVWTREKTSTDSENITPQTEGTERFELGGERGGLGSAGGRS